MTPDPSTMPRPFRVVSTMRETRDVVTLCLDPANEGEPIVAAPGQFNMLYQFGVGEVPISISHVTQRPTLTHTIRDVGAVTRALCSAKPGDLVGVRGPFGQPWPLTEAQGTDLLFIAGGIGLAPLRPAIDYALSHREYYNRICLLYGSRSPEDLLFREDLRRWQSQADQVFTTVDAAGEDWTGDVGVVTSLLRRTRFDPQHATAFICGPEIMMRFTAADLLKRGVPKEQIVVSLERSFSCALGLCGRCQLGPEFICKDGPVFRYSRVAERLAIPEL